jgi:GT2 family glycosyltransferase
LVKVAVVILNWNGKRFLEQFLPVVLRHSQGQTEVIIADNASTDDSVAYLKEHHPDVRLVINEQNGGFAKGYNDALKQIHAEYYVLLNSDIEVTENWIEPVIRLMDTDPSIAACQPKLRSWHERSRFEYAGAAGGFIDRYGYPFCRGRIFFSVEEDTGQYDDACEVFWATGACMFVRAELYHRYGGLDEDFFAHMEEIDFCWRLKTEGYKIMYCPESVVYHIGGGTLPKSAARKTYLNFRNNFTLLFKNLPGKNVFPVFFVRFILDGVAGVKFLVDGGFSNLYAVTKAHFAFYKRYPQNLRKRKKIKHRDVNCIYRGNLVWDHYIAGKKKFSQLAASKFR